MSRPGRDRRVRRWYCAAWWARYGDELVALLDDTYADGPLPWRARWALAREGTLDRMRRGGLVGSGAPRELRLRAGALSVLVAGALYVAAGCVVAKFFDNWEVATPASARPLIGAAVVGAQAGAGLGALAGLGAALVSLRATVACLRAMAPREARRLLAPVAAPAVVALATSGAVVGLAHHLSAAQRNGADVAYTWVFALWCVGLAASLAVGVVGVVRVVLRVQYREGELRLLAPLCAVAATAMVVVLGSTVVWWAQMARHARGFFAPGAPSAVLAPPLVAATVVMVAGAALALRGVVRALGARRELPCPPATTSP